MTTPIENPNRSLTGELAQQLRHYGRLMRLDRPIGIWLLLWPTLWALWIASAGRPTPHVFIVFVLGVIVMRSAGCVMNDLADRKFDGAVERTKDRPLAAGQVTPVEAVVLFLALLLIAVALVLTLDRLTQMLAVVGAVLTVVYPFMKRFIAAPQVFLGAAFGWGVPMAFAAETGEVPRLAWLIWLTAVVWAVIYDTMYAMADRKDDRKLGIKSTAILFGSADVFIVMMLQIVMLLALLLIGADSHLGAWYTGSVIVATAFSFYQFMLIRDRDPQACFRAFLNNRFVGAAIFAGIVLDYTFAPIA
ncbi:MAG: 4-hydroxybenzoate octaprenyltransferase [Gammaproteobacteria bacterium]